MAGQQVRNGKSFEYALASQYAKYLFELGVNVELVEDAALEVARNYYNEFTLQDQEKFNNAARQTIETMVKIEPGLTAPNGLTDVLRIRLCADGEGEDGDVRDVVFSRFSPNWEIGFSAKNNNDDVKHSRLGARLDFGASWVGIPCSQSYWDEIRPIFDYCSEMKNHHATWDELGEDKINRVYKPLLSAFRKELLRISENNPDVPRKLVEYLIGRHSFYKIIKDDSNNLVVVKAFNINGDMNKTRGGKRTRYKVPRINLPTRIVEFDYMKGREDNTLDMILDEGWEISFRIHNASTYVENSLKFAIQLLGNPPILFTQYLFQEDTL